MKSKLIMDSTTNRGEFNRAYKFYLEHKGKIRCSRCRYHLGENRCNNHYGGAENKKIKFPNWKLVSKNKKQWMNKTIEIIEYTRGWGKWKKKYIAIKF